MGLGLGVAWMWPGCVQAGVISPSFLPAFLAPPFCLDLAWAAS